MTFRPATELATSLRPLAAVEGARRAEVVVAEGIAVDVTVILAVLVLIGLLLS